jgi:hypothetical protein
MKNGNDAVDQGGQESDALSAEHALQHHADKRPHAAERRETVVHGVHAACREACGDKAEQSALDDAEPDFLALHVAAGLGRAGRHIDARLRQHGRTGLFRYDDHR